MQEGIRAIAFDLDDTLAVSKSQIDQRMAGLLGRLLGLTEVCIISGGKFEQFEVQVLRHLETDPTSLARLHIMPTCGTRYYRWLDSAWKEIYAEDLDDSDKRRIIDALTEGAKELRLWQADTWGEKIEDRGSQITYSALGQLAPPSAKYAWDPDGSKKKSLREYAAQKLPDLEVRVGGSTSVDVTRKGIDKAHGIQKLIDYLDLSLDELLFIGDRLEEGGNDYPVKAMGVRCVAVSRWQDTADYIEQLLASYPNDHSGKIENDIARSLTL